jgi:leucyl-tRNA synthetase
MDEKYFAKKIERSWQKKWADTRAFEAEIDSSKPKFYQLEMLPYPSGNLHMGHVRNYSAGDALAWYKRLQGFNVLHPIGWDSFGQPAEDAAVKRGVNPRKWTDDNIETMRGQLKRLGLSYDWRRQMYAHRPEYYKFDQWFFIKMFERGLAYKRKTSVNWCENDQATLSNEQASGGLCWRCGNPVTKKELEQWFLKTTSYSDQLLDDMAEIEAGWPPHVIKRQQDWIGRSEGAFVDFAIRPANDKSATDLSDSIRTIRVFTTRIDTIYGANAVVIAPEHPLVEANRQVIGKDVVAEIESIIAERSQIKEREAEVEKVGIDTGIEVTNPFSGDVLPVWVGNYVMMDYGTGAVMSVPAHDERDHELARKYGLPVRQVISVRNPDDEYDTGRESTLEFPLTEDGVLVNSDNWSGKASPQARTEMTQFAKENGFGEAGTTFRLRDWGISRQRYWGAPIPVVYCDQCGTVPALYENLPVRLPDDAPITGTGESPLAKVPEFYNTVCPKCSGAAIRETDTMDTFVDSSWYFYRYTDADNEMQPFDPDKASYWTPVDQYIGGDDHAVMHLIYARFWTKVMRDLGLVPFGEPFRRLLTQGMVVGETFFDDSTGKRIYFPPDQVEVERDPKGKIVSAAAAGTSTGADSHPTDNVTTLKYAIERMSKSKGNGVDPDEMVEIYGADATRLFVLFAAPIENELVWNEAGIEGAVRFLQRVWRLVHKWQLSDSKRSTTHPNDGQDAASIKLRRKTHQTIKRVADSFEQLQFNTPVSALMELSNLIAEIDPEMTDENTVSAKKEALTSLVLMLAPYAPHFSEELYAVLTDDERGMAASGARFPVFIEEFAQTDEIEIAVQVNGKLRSRILASPETPREKLEELALNDPKVLQFIQDREIRNVIVVPKRLVNIVV